MSPAKLSATTIFALTAPSGVTSADLRRWTLRARRRLRLGGRIAVVTVRPSISRQLNRQYRRRDRATNVLSFDYAHPRSTGPHGRDVDGEVVLCPAVIRREAPTVGRTYQTHFRFLLEHGFIHLLGLDHRTARQQRAWSRYERRLL